MKKMTEEEAFLLMEEQGWQPMPCDTPVPVYDVPASCGLPLPLGNETNDFKMVPKGILASMDSFFVRAKGDSMIGANIIDGDLVLVDKTAQVYDSDIVVVLIDGECVLKCYCTDDEGQTWLAPRNDAYDAIPVREGQDLFIFGVVTEVWRKSPRVTHRECIDVVNRTKRRARKPKEFSLSEVQAAIRDIAPKVTNGRQWFAVYRALADRKLVGEECFEAFCRLVTEAVPEHPRLPVYTEMQRMSVMCFAKPIWQWQADNAPVTGKRYLDYLMLAKEMLKRLEENVKK